MRYSREHKQASRKRLIEAAARLFRARGYHATGLDQVVRAAGLTPGAFYRHFPSKAALLSAGMKSAAADALRHTNEGLEELAGEKWLHAFVDRYLSEEHLRDFAGGCPIAALGTELAKETGEARRALDAAARTTVAAIAQRLGAKRRDSERAWNVLASCVGALTLARSVRDGIQQSSCSSKEGGGPSGKWRRPWTWASLEHRPP
jgi:TetR/AcrR family transcriptional repressor of nem operon